MNKINHRFQCFNKVCFTLVRIQNSNDVIRYSSLSLEHSHTHVSTYSVLAVSKKIWWESFSLVYFNLSAWCCCTKAWISQSTDLLWIHSARRWHITVYILNSERTGLFFFQLLPTKRLNGSSWVSQANPKSVSFASMLVKSTIIFSGLISLCKIPCSSHWIVASRICVKNRLPSSSVIPSSTSMMSNRSEESSGRSST